MSKKPYVLVIGAAGVDSKGRATVPLVSGSSVRGLVLSSVGGVARNIADNLARLGIDVILLSVIGDDDHGKRILTNAAKVGINTDYMIVSTEYHTAAYLAILDEKANLVLSVDNMEILACLTPHIIEEQRNLIKEAEMVVMDGNLSQETINCLFKITDRYKQLVCADPVSIMLAEGLKSHLSNLYILSPNAAEAEILCGHSVSDENEAIVAARTLVSNGVDIAIISLGERGVVYASDGESGHVPAMDIDIVDNTGASDALTATVVFGLLNNISLGEAVRLGTAAATLTLGCRDTVCADLNLEMLYDRLLV